MKVTTVTFAHYLQTVLTGLLVFITLLILLLGAANIYANDRFPQTAYKNPTTESYTFGTKVSVGSHRLYVRCQGEERPTIIIDTGLGDVSLEWNHIQKAVAPHARICLYDRAGYGHSDAGPLPRTSSHIVEELHQMLINAAIEGPYILVGHSFGGYTMQLFASRYRELTAGVILVDSSHRDQYARFLAPPINVKTAPPNKEKLGIVRFAPPPIHPNLPAEIRDEVRQAMLDAKMRYATAYEFYNFRKSADEVKASKPFPAVPLLVLTRGKRVYPEGHHGDLMEALWMELQSELSALSPYSGHVVAHDSGHFIHLDQPQLVIDSISFLVDVIRYRAINRNYPVEVAQALEPERYDFFEATWRSNQLYYDSMLGHIFPSLRGRVRSSASMNTSLMH